MSIVKDNRLDEKIQIVKSELMNKYPDAECELDFNSNFELLVATILSAQCTDKRVNIVTKELYKTHSTPQDFASMEYAELEKKIFSCGFYRNKAKSIINMSRELLLNYNGVVPDDFNELVKLPGVGRKTANVVMAVGFNGNNIAVDTHVFRVSRRLGFSEGNTPEKVEKDLMNVFEEKDYSVMHHLLIFHGRYCCKSQKPMCSDCPLTNVCTFYSLGSKT